MCHWLVTAAGTSFIEIQWNLFIILIENTVFPSNQLINWLIEHRVSKVKLTDCLTANSDFVCARIVQQQKTNKYKNEPKFYWVAELSDWKKQNKRNTSKLPNAKGNQLHQFYSVRCESSISFHPLYPLTISIAKVNVK